MVEIFAIGLKFSFAVEENDHWKSFRFHNSFNFRLFMDLNLPIFANIFTIKVLYF